MNHSIDILLSTYNGAAFLPEQLDSLRAQSCQDFRILARDDGSQDGTRDILVRYAAEHAGRLELRPDDGRRLGAAASFAGLLDRSTAPYTMFCDQDDVWLPDKVGSTLGAMRELERAHGATTPLLVCTDLRVVDAGLGVIDESFWHFQRIHPERLTRLSRVLMQNFATGCTVMINRPLAELAAPVPAEAIMHDWWLALVTTVFGRAAHLRQPTVLYRQHGKNDIGATRWRFLDGVKNFFFDRQRRRAGIARQREIDQLLTRQAAAFAARFATRLSLADQARLRAFRRLPDLGFFRRRALLLRHGFLISDRWQTFMMMIR
jgi:glycosyltransferase involved in cell wall biosynthesis